MDKYINIFYMNITGKSTPKKTPRQKRNPSAEIGVTDRNTGATYTTAIKNKTRKLRHTSGFREPKKINLIRTIRNTIRNVKSPDSPFFLLGTNIRIKEQSEQEQLFRNVLGEGQNINLKKLDGSKRKTRKRKKHIMKK